MADDSPARDRRRAPLPALRQPAGPATVHAVLGDRELVEHGEVVALTDRTVVIDMRDPTIALAFSLAAEVAVVLDLGSGHHSVLAVPGRRSSDNATSRRVELVLRSEGGT